MKKGIVESKYFTVLLHVLIWSTFFTLQILSFQASVFRDNVEFSERPKPRFEERDHKPDRRIIIESGRMERGIKGEMLRNFYFRFIFQSIVMVAIYYLNSLILIPRLLFRNHIIKYVIALVLTLLIVIVLDSIYSYFEFDRRLFAKRPPVLLFLSGFIIALSTSVKLAQKWYENETQRKAMIHEKVNSELLVLKSQVNPHFLFNTLNGIYSLANSKSDKTALAIVKLSQLMRYMLDESKQHYVPLSSEIDYINTFIELQKMRLFDNVKIEFNINGDQENIQIQPLLLIPFIENAFKHGTDSSTNCTIDIDLDILKDSINLEVKNDILNSGKQEANSGFGLSNIRRRLELEYPQKHILKTEISGNKYIARLFINLE